VSTLDPDAELADRLARVLPWVVDDGNGVGHAASVSAVRLRNLQVGHQGDAAQAVALELEAFLAAHPELVTTIRAATRRQQRRRLAEALEQLLAPTSGAQAGDRPDDHVVSVLRTLLVEQGPPRVPRVARLRQGAAMSRGTAALWMTALVAIPIAWVGAMDRLGVTALPVGLDGNTLAVRVLAVWALAFLPGWLYVRFLGQRAGALWNEYVLQLHRLGWDVPQFLPRPPESSEFHDEWLEAGGHTVTREDNIYRQKFNAYYGRAVSEGTASEDFPVRSQSMFPVYLATVVLATGWVAVLVDTGWATAPAGVTDLLRFAFLGAYAFIVQSLIRRFFQSDLRPSAYAGAILRIVLALLVVVPLHLALVPRIGYGSAAVVAFVVGGLPAVGLQALHRMAAATLRVLMPQMTPDYPLNQLDGLNVWYEARLVEEGIEDMQNLATANLVDVILHTRVPVGRLVDWIDQAHLYLHLDRAERGTVERLRSGRRRRGVDGTGTRAGSQARHGLRRMGIRSATDLLKAFPPEQRATWSGAGDDARPDGLTAGQLDTLVRVLAAQPALVPVWNWQRRGSGATGVAACAHDGTS
jgi:hypothetical protein